MINHLVQAKVSRSSSRSRSNSSSTTTSTRSNISGRAKEDSKETFADFFGSKSSGIGSERRSSSICADNPEELEKSSNCIPSDPEVVSPLLSPDSCLEDESLLEEPSLCFECATRAAVEAGGEIEEKNEPLEATLLLGTLSIKDVLATVETVYEMLFVPEGTVIELKLIVVVLPGCKEL